MISLYLSMVVTDEDRDKVVFIYENYYSFMCHSAGRVLGGDRFDIEDAVHDAMLKLIENIEFVDFSDKDRVRNLCGVVARNKAVDLLRRRGSRGAAPEEELLDIADDIGPEDIVIGRETFDIVLRALRSLDPVYKDACVLKYIYRLKEREIAELLDVTPEAVNIRIFRGKQILRDALRREKIYE